MALGQHQTVAVGLLDIAELLSYLYFVEMNIDPKDPKKADRDRLVPVSYTHLSKPFQRGTGVRRFAGICQRVRACPDRTHL